MANYSRIEKFLPPETHQILEEHLPDGTQWYEMRSNWRVASFSVSTYDSALSNARRLMRIFPSSSLFYCWKEDGELHDTKIL